MKPVDQDVFGTPYGNCLAACVASILELPLIAVPNFMAFTGPKRDAWWDAFDIFLRSRALVRQYRGHLDEAAPPAGYAILSGQSPRGPFLHSVVALDGEMVHDPHPSRDGLLTRQDWIWWVPMEPAPA